MENFERQHLQSIEELILDINEFLKGVSYEDLIINKEKLSAVKLSLLNIGDSVNILSVKTKQHYNSIDWKKISGFRNRTTHNYLGLDVRKLWDIIQNEIEPLKVEISKIRQDYHQYLNAKLLDGKKLSEEILAEIALEVSQIKSSGKKAPHLAAILVGSDGASETYVASKVRNCEKVGFESTLIRLEENVTEAELLNQINLLNDSDQIDGFIVQLPLPKHISEKKVIEAINPAKDVDGFHPMSVGKMALNLPTFISATPNGVLEMLKRYKIETEGKNCVVLGRSHIVGSPMSILMARNGYPGNATVTLCHSKTQNLKQITNTADILIVAIGRPEFVTADFVKEGAVVIDVGIHRTPDATKKSGFKLVGDVKFDEVAPKCSFLTPVPGGVGLMTICSLLQNTLKAAKRN